MVPADNMRALIVGLGSSGVSALRYLLNQGYEVDVTDSASSLPVLGGAEFAGRVAKLVCGEMASPRAPSAYRLAVISPGVDPRQPLVRALAAAGVDCVNDIELFARACSAPVIAVTGSNGKSTVVSMLGHVLAALGERVAVGGNIGTPALDLLDVDASLVVLELSSFQLELLQSLKTQTAVCLNVSEDHLDRHEGLEAYAAVKRRIYERCERPLINRDDVLASKDVVAWASFGDRSSDAARDWHLNAHADGLWIFRGKDALLDTAELRVAGRHNALNAMAALAMLDAAGYELDAAAIALCSFGGLPHRCEWVGRYDQVDYYNDSKGTNVGSTLAALAGLKPPIIWLGGGLGKGQDFRPLGPVLQQRAKAAVTFGRDGAQIAAAIEGRVPVYTEATLEESVQRAHALAEHGDTVLLSPACASFDQFSGYQARGLAFAQCVKAVCA